MKSRRTFTRAEIIINTLILGGMACLLHYVYDISGRRLFVGLLNPVNESVWEHLKLMFFPFLLWWLIIYYLKNEKCDASSNTWIVSAAISLITAPLLVAMLFYTYTGALGIESVFIDILLAFICYFLALCVASHVLKYSSPGKLAAIGSIIVVAIIFIAFILFTINPPKLPIFK